MIDGFSIGKEIGGEQLLIIGIISIMMDAVQEVQVNVGINEVQLLNNWIIGIKNGNAIIAVLYLVLF